MQKPSDGSQRPRRIDVELPAVLTTSDGHAYKVLVRDLSAEGFRLELDDELVIGEAVLLQVGREPACRAEIKWALGREAGGIFVE
jgi:hypothetical protein